MNEWVCMFVSYLTPPQWLNLILGFMLLHFVNPQIWGLKKKFNCSLQQPTEILRDKEYLSWFFDLCFIFVTHGGSLRKITINLQWLLWRKIHSYWKSCIYISIIRSKTFYFKFKSSSMNWFKTELCVCFTCSNFYIIKFLEFE